MLDAVLTPAPMLDAVHSNKAFESDLAINKYKKFATCEWSAIRTVGGKHSHA